KTTRDVVLPVLRDESRLDADEFGVGICGFGPDRTFSAIRTEPVVVSGTDPAATRATATILDSITTADVMRCDSPTTVETVCVVESAFRELLETFATELSLRTREFGTEMATVLGIATARAGGTVPMPEVTIPSTAALSSLLDTTASKPNGLSAAVRTGESLPSKLSDVVVAELAANDLDPDRSVALLCGLPIDPEVPSMDASNVFELVRSLISEGVGVFVTDPAVEPSDSFRDFQIPMDAIGEVSPDVILYLDDRPAFESIDWAVFDDPVVIDLRGTLSAESIGHDVTAIGRTA
ncbi:MAG: hypothetical protein ACQETB_12365, partial [Halobacteriota archaeon]